MLRRREGASGPQIAEATGWAPHTVRGFLAGLARKGIKVDVLDRVRQVGPSKARANGSYTIYCVIDASPMNHVALCQGQTPIRTVTSSPHGPATHSQTNRTFRYKSSY